MKQAKPIFYLTKSGFWHPRSWYVYPENLLPFQKSSREQMTPLRNISCHRRGEAGLSDTTAKHMQLPFTVLPEIFYPEKRWVPNLPKLPATM